MQRYTNLLIIVLTSMLAFTTFTFSDEIFLEKENIPSLKGAFSSDPEKFTFAIIGDKTGGGQQNWPIFDTAMEEINGLNPDFAVTVGDHIQGYISDLNAVKVMWDEYMEHISKLNVPVMLVPGNHDITNTAMYNYWKENIGKTYYSFDYKGCHFLIFNTEEHRSPEKAEVAEKAMMDFAIDDIQKNKDARHIFIFMHRPLWVDSKRWEPIETALKGAKATVFGGHWHRLIYERRGDITYVVTGATGAGITDIPLPQLGRFHHFALVSVEGSEANIAVIRPGNIFPEDISIREVHQRVQESMIKIRPEMPIPIAGETVTGKLIATIDNKADEPILARISMVEADDSLWKIMPREVAIEASPGQKAESVFEFVYSADSILSHPKYTVENYYAGISLGKRERFISFADTAAMRGIDEWMTGGISNLPDSEVRETVVNFFTDHKIDEDSLSWQLAPASNRGRVDMERVYDKPDNTMAYARTFIHSPEGKTIWGAIAADDLVAVFVNGEQIAPLYDLDNWHGGVMFFPISLKAEWNHVMVKSADFTGGWYFTFVLDDPDSQLKFSSQMP